MQTTMTKNIALAGHAGSGKTTLCEALLYQSGVTERIGKITEGNTVSDYTAEEIKRKSSVYTTLSPFAPMPYRSIFWIHPECLTLPER